jgi:oxygen-dependent protoporphyrinogen oxidase
VVGGGIAGLAAAWELVSGAAATDRVDPATVDVPTVDVHVLEAGDRVGGVLRSTGFAGRQVDLGADAFLARRPEATALCTELGLRDRLVPVGASGASIWARGRLRTMPDGLLVGVPTHWLPLARSGILTPRESLRAARDLLVPALGTGMDFGDRAVGPIVADRLGLAVVERLVDPLVGGIHAGGVDDLSAAATFPQLLAAAHQGGSLMRRLGQARSAAVVAVGGTGGGTGGGQSPVFWSLPDGTASLATELSEALVARGVTIHTGAAVEALEHHRAPTVAHGRDPATGPGRDGWRIALGGAGAQEVDGVVLAVPAGEAATLLAPHAPRAADLLGTIEYASVAVITVSVDRASVGHPLEGTGFLIPRTTRFDGRPALVTGCTFLSRKWPHLARGDDELLRMSVGRFGDERHRSLDDDELTAAAFGELARVLDIWGGPTAVQVTRWDRAFPQYRVGHLMRIARLERDIAAVGGLAIAGAALRGVGIPACIGSGRAAAAQVRDALAARNGAELVATTSGRGPAGGPGRRR